MTLSQAQLEQCSSCIFLPEDLGGLQLRPGRLEEITASALECYPHQCHNSETLACRGARDITLQYLHHQGVLPEPTDAALEQLYQGYQKLEALIESR